MEGLPLSTQFCRPVSRGVAALEFFPEVVVPIDQGESGFSLLPQLILHLSVGEKKKESFHRFPVKGHRAGREMILHGPVRPVRGEFAVFSDQLPLQFLEVAVHPVGIGVGRPVVDGDFEEAPVKESALNRTCGRIGKGSFLGADCHNPKCGLLARKRNVNVQGMPGGPRNQFFGRISPLQSERRFEQRLGVRFIAHGHHECQAEQEAEEDPCHGGRIRIPGRRRKRRAAGSMLVETAMALSLLTALGLGMLKLCINITAPRQWTLQQSVTDAYMTYERALAERVPFEQITGDGSLWPAFPNSARSTVELGKLPGGRAITGTVVRTRIPDPNNFPEDGGSGTLATNPARMKVWKLQSVVHYEVGNRSYVKSRTVIRSQ